MQASIPVCTAGVGVASVLAAAEGVSAAGADVLVDLCWCFNC